MPGAVAKVSVPQSWIDAYTRAQGLGWEALQWFGPTAPLVSVADVYKELVPTETRTEHKEETVGLLSKLIKKAVKYAPVVAPLLPIPGAGMLGKVLSATGAGPLGAAGGAGGALGGGLLGEVLKATVKKGVKAAARERVIPGVGKKLIGAVAAGAVAAGGVAGYTAAELRRMVKEGTAQQTTEGGNINVWDSETGALLGTIKRARRRKTSRKRKASRSRKPRRRTTKKRRTSRARGSAKQRAWRKKFVQKYAGKRRRR